MNIFEKYIYCKERKIFVRSIVSKTFLKLLKLHMPRFLSYRTALCYLYDFTFQFCAKSGFKFHTRNFYFKGDGCYEVNAPTWHLVSCLSGKTKFTLNYIPGKN